MKTHETVAVKKIQWTSRPGKDMNEVDFLMKLHHENIVKVLGTYKTRSSLYFILE
jgi:hypothetical protein